MLDGFNKAIMKWIKEGRKGKKPTKASAAKETMKTVKPSTLDLKPLYKTFNKNQMPWDPADPDPRHPFGFRLKITTDPLMTPESFKEAKDKHSPMTLKLLKQEHLKEIILTKQFDFQFQVPYKTEEAIIEIPDLELARKK